MISGFSVQEERMKQLVEMPRAKKVGALIPLPTQKLEANLDIFFLMNGEEWGLCICVYIFGVED